MGLRARKTGSQTAGGGAPARAPAARDLFGSVVANLPGAIYRCRSDDWRMVYLGGAFEVITGYSPDDFIDARKREFTSLHHPDDLARVVERFRLSCERREPFEDEFRIVRADGGVRWVQERARPVLDRAGAIQWLDGVFLDITEKKQAENALRESEERFRTVLANSPGAIYRASADGWTIEFISNAIERISGYTEEEFLALYNDAPERFYHPDDLQEFRTRIATSLVTRQPFDCEYRYRHKSGEIRWALERARVIADGSGKVRWMDGIITDITEQKEAERALRESEEQFASTFAHAAIGMALVAPDGRWLKVNRALCELTGYPEEELLRLTFQDITHPDDLESDLNFVRQMLTGKIRTYQMEKRYIHKQGHTIWILLSVSLIWDRQDRPLHFIAQIQNITERKEAERALRESEEKFRTAVMNSPGAIFRSTPDGWHASFVSDAVEGITGYTPEEFCALHPDRLAEFYHPDDLPALQAAIAAAIRDKKPSDGEYRFRHKSGEIRWALERARPVLDERGEVRWFDGVITDVTERKRAEERLRENEAMFRSIVEGVPGAIYRTVYDRDSETITDLYLSDGIEGIVGYSAAELVAGSPVRLADLLHPDDRSIVTTAMDRAVGRGEPYNIEFRFRHRDGSLRWVNGRGSAVCQPSGQGVFLQGVIFDVTEQKRAAEALAAAHRELEAHDARFRIMVANVPGAIYRCRPSEDWPMEYVSDAIEAITGYPAGDFLGNAVRSFGSLVHPEDVPDSYADLMAELRRGHPITAEYRIVHADGSIRWVHERARGVLNERGELVAVDGGLFDVTARKRAEEEAARNAQLVERLLDHSPVQINIKDVEGRYRLVNRALQEDMGHPISEILGRTVYDFYPKDTADVTTENHRRVLAERRAVQHEQVVTRNGRTQHLIATRFPLFDESGEVVAVGYVGSDVTQLKEAEREAQRVARMIQDVVDHSPAYITVKDPEGRYRLVNRKVESQLKRPREDILGRTADDFFPADVARISDAAHRRVLEERRPVALEERVPFDGGTLYYAATRFPIFDESGEVVAVGNIGTDVTEKVTREKELKELAERLALARDQAEAANRAKSDFLAVMSHEIRTPLNGILGMTGLLLESGLEENQRSYAEAVQTSAESLNAIINDILDYSKLEARKLELEVGEFDPKELAEQVIMTFAPQLAGSAVEMSCFVSPDLPRRLRGDAARLRQVLNNLVGNAVKFTAEGGISLEVMGVPRGSTAFVLRAEIADTGIGVDPGALPRLFERFTQADSSIGRRFGGTGLGLSIVKELVTLMEGEVGAEGRPGKGSRFWITVPLEAVGGPGTAGAEGDELSGLRALVVERNAVSRRSLKRQLEAWGVETQAVPDGASAQAACLRAEERKEPFVLALVGEGLADMTAAELAPLLRHRSGCAGTKLVLLASPHRELAADGPSAIFDGVLLKPVRPSVLAKTLCDLAAGDPAPRTDSAALDATIAGEEPALRRKRLLVVEDNPVNSRVACAILERAGYLCDVAPNGHVGVEKASRETYDAVLMDIQMPERDGFWATAAIRDLPGARGRVPIIAVTAYALRGDRERCLNAGMDDYIAKPIKQKELLETAEKWTGRSGSAVPSREGGDPASVPAVLDEGVMAELEEALGREAVAELVRENVEATRGQVGRLFAALAAEDFPALERHAHDLKSTLGSFGALAASRRAAAVETVSKAERREELRRLVAEAEQAADEALSALAARYPAPGAPR